MANINGRHTACLPRSSSVRLDSPPNSDGIVPTNEFVSVVSNPSSKGSLIVMSTIVTQAQQSQQIADIRQAYQGPIP